MILLDTNVISETMCQQPAPEVMRWIQENADDLFISVPELTELWAGIEWMPRGARRSEMTDKLRRIIDFATAEEQLLDMTPEIAQRYGMIIADRRRRGFNLDIMDGLIAATALAQNAAIATRNMKDFEGIGLRLINPWED
jgi:hypothetical protein